MTQSKKLINLFVECISTAVPNSTFQKSKYLHLTLGTKYRVIDQSATTILICNNVGADTWYPKGNFNIAPLMCNQVRKPDSWELKEHLKHPQTREVVYCMIADLLKKNNVPNTLSFFLSDTLLPENNEVAQLFAINKLETLYTPVYRDIEKKEQDTGTLLNDLKKLISKYDG